MNPHASILAQSKGKKNKVSADSVSTAAKELGSLGGQVGGPARAKFLSGSQRREIAIHAINKRWGKLCNCSYCR